MSTSPLVLETALAAGVLVAFWRLYKHCVVKAANKNLPGPSSISWLTGNFTQIYSMQGWDFHHDLAKRYGGAVKVHAFVGDEQIYFSDPRALYHVCIKDQDAFEETDMFLSSMGTVFGAGLFGVTGEQHRKQRKMLNPVFSVAHLRKMLPTFQRISNKLRDVMLNKISNGERELDMLDLASCAALEFVGEAGLGYSFGTLNPHPPKPYVQALRLFMPNLMRLAFLRYAMPYLCRLGPPRFRRFLVDHMPMKRVQEMKKVSDTLHETALEIYMAHRRQLESTDKDMREEILVEEDNILSILMRANMDAPEHERFTDAEVLGSMNTLVFAATDTTSSAISRTLELLAMHSDVQNRLREELLDALAAADGDLSYDTLEGLPLLDAICRETLRLHSPVTFVIRTCRKDTLVPLNAPVTGTDGQPIRDVLVRKGQNVFVGIAACNRNAGLWGADAEVWKPERWMEKTPTALAEAHVPGVYAHTMTFLGGNRACIGFKFSQLEMKAVLATLISSFSFALPENSEIDWWMTQVACPSVKGQERSQMPMKVSVAKS